MILVFSIFNDSMILSVFSKDPQDDSDANYLIFKQKSNKNNWRMPTFQGHNIGPGKHFSQVKTGKSKSLHGIQKLTERS